MAFIIVTLIEFLFVHHIIIKHGVRTNSFNGSNCTRISNNIGKRKRSRKIGGHEMNLYGQVFQCFTCYAITQDIQLITCSSSSIYVQYQAACRKYQHAIFVFHGIEIAVTCKSVDLVHTRPDGTATVIQLFFFR